MLLENGLDIGDGGQCNKEENVYLNNMIIDERNNNRILDTLEDDTLDQSETPIQKFYANESVFITGGTGFLGKILIEKLLRSTNISNIYLLVRSKKGKDTKNRIEELFQDRVYDRLKKEVPKFRDKIVAISGDCSVEGLDLSNSDRQLLLNEVSIVFHVAATVRFDESLKLATAINVQSTAEIVDICKEMRKLKSFIHVSTAYANCHEKQIDERFYSYPVSSEDVISLVNILPEESLADMTPRIIGQWPNTYTFTKAIAETLIRRGNEGLPMGIFRPAIVVSTAHEPLAGWIDNMYGPTGIVAGVTTGALRIVNCDPNVIANIVPVDVTVNALIASAWDVYTQTNRRNENMLIYNFVSNVEAPLTWREYCETNLMYGSQYPLSTCMWHITLTLIKNKMPYTVAVWFAHLLPALLVDIVKLCMGQKPRLWRIYEKIHKFSAVISYFCTNEWKFTNNNVQAMWLKLHPKDQRLFRFSMKGFDWSKYFTTYIMGIRIHLFNDDLSTLEFSRTRCRRLYWMHQVLKTIVVLAGLWILWSIVCVICI